MSLVFVVAVGCQKPAPPPPLPSCGDEEKETKPAPMRPVPSGMPLHPVTLTPFGPDHPQLYHVDDDTLLHAMVLASREELPLGPVTKGRRIVLAAPPGSLFEKAGLRVHDAITAVAGTAVDDDDVLADALSAWRKDRAITIALERNGEPLELTYTRARPPAKPSNEPWGGEEVTTELPRSRVEEMLSDQVELMRSARVVPHKEGDRVVGLRLERIRPNTVAAVLGFEDGDIVHRVAGYDLTRPELALEAYARTRGADEVRVDLVRKGKRMTFVYRLADATFR